MADLDWRHLPALSALRAFEAAARLGGFSAAARALNVTPAAVAQQVRGLEADLGLPLTRRDGRAIALTSEGTRLAARLADGFSTIATGIAEARRGAATRGLRVTTTTYITDALILPRIGEFWQRHPGVEVAFNPGACLQDVTPDFFDRSNFDILIAAGAGDWKGVATELLLECPFVIVGTQDLCRRARRDLGNVPWIWHAGDGCTMGTLRAIGVDLDRVPHVDVGSARLELGAARAGHGLTLASKVVAQPDLDAGTLTSLPVPGTLTARYHVVTPPGRRRPQVSQFTGWLHELADDWRRSQSERAA